MKKTILFTTLSLLAGTMTVANAEVSATFGGIGSYDRIDSKTGYGGHFSLSYDFARELPEKSYIFLGDTYFGLGILGNITYKPEVAENKNYNSSFGVIARITRFLDDNIYGRFEMGPAIYATNGTSPFKYENYKMSLVGGIAFGLYLGETPFFSEIYVTNTNRNPAAGINIGYTFGW